MDVTYKIGPDFNDDTTIGWKTGVRVIGVSESFKKAHSKSIVVGVIMRGDYRIDGFGVCHPMIGGTDSTESFVKLYQRIGRQDIRAWMLGGSVISWFNVVDIVELHRITEIPVVCVTYNPSEGIERYLKEYFPQDWKTRLAILEKAGERTPISLDTGHEAFLTTAGVGVNRAKRLLDLFTIDGRIPEPVRVARLVAAGLLRDIYNDEDEQSFDYTIGNQV
jgi:endonuclease V-like protein UPF0215 family